MPNMTPSSAAAIVASANSQSTLALHDWCKSINLVDKQFVVGGVSAEGLAFVLAVAGIAQTPVAKIHAVVKTGMSATTVAILDSRRD